MFLNRKTLFAPTLLLALILPITAQSAPVPATMTPAAKLEDLRASGFDALYNLDYEAARKQFTELRRIMPDHPAGPQWLAATLWAQILNESRGLQASVYSNDAYYAQTEAKPDPKVVAEFNALTKEALDLVLTVCSIFDSDLYVADVEHDIDVVLKGNWYS